MFTIIIDVIFFLLMILNPSDPAANGSLPGIVFTELARIGQNRFEELNGHDLFALIKDRFDTGHSDILNHP